jgi:hypothetical protein
MNPFLIIALILAWAICLGSACLSYLTPAERDTSGLQFLAIIAAGVIGIFLLIACGASWHQLHGA